MNEIWIDVENYEGLYQISNLGRVKSLIKNKILKENYNEYKQVYLYKNGKGKWHKVHRLVAIAFIENPYKLDFVNHIDENKYNNCVDNLEWCTKKYNCNYGKRNEKMSKSKSKYKIIQKDKNNNIVKVWNSMWDLEHNTSYNKWVIRQCCNNKCKTCYGYKWQYENIT